MPSLPPGLSAARWGLEVRSQFPLPPGRDKRAGKTLYRPPMRSVSGWLLVGPKCTPFDWPHELGGQLSKRIGCAKRRAALSKLAVDLVVEEKIFG